MKKIILSAIITLAVQLTYAQQTKKKVHFSNISNVGIIVGRNSSGVAIQTINGLKIKRSWAIGLGVGYDPYEVPGIPVFIDVRKYIVKNIWQPFAYADGGMNFTLHNANYPKKWGNGERAYTFNPSIYEEAGIGISRPVSAAAKFFISAGYSIKEFNFTQRNSGIIIDPGPVWPFRNPDYRYRYTYNRLAIKLGLEF